LGNRNDWKTSSTQNYRGRSKGFYEEKPKNDEAKHNPIEGKINKKNPTGDAGG